MVDYSLNISSYTGLFMKEMYKKMENDLLFGFIPYTKNDGSSIDLVNWTKHLKEKENKMVETFAGNRYSLTYNYDCGVNGLTLETPKKKATVPEVKQIIYNKKSTIVIWKDDSKTKVTCGDNDTYSEEAGVAMCFMKKIFGDRSKFLKLVRQGYSQVDRKSKESKE